MDPIWRNIRALAKTRHVEVTTPVIQGVNDADLRVISDFISSIDNEIPWHVFRLLPEHEMKDSDYPNIEEINRSIQAARGDLKYVYFHNFVGSDWVNTICPQCGAEVIERFSLGCGGDKLDSYNCPGNQCPTCGYKIKILGEYIPVRDERTVVA
jgi:DNA-directed RNA polymerase subunit RPC12/RpoP